MVMVRRPLIQKAQPVPQQSALGRKDVEFPPAFQELFRAYRYKVYYGGRGGGKSWAIARYAIIDAITHCHLWLCTREFQSSIKDSVHNLLVAQINSLGLSQWFKVTQSEIICTWTGSRFIFKGLRHNVDEIKSTEGIDRCWVEEAQNMSEESLEILIPTIRREKSELIFSFNPKDATDAVYKKFIDNQEENSWAPPPDSFIRKVNWNENPYFPKVLDLERRWLLEHDPEAYAWVWGGECRVMDETTIFRNIVVEDFESPPIGLPKERVRWRFGADWGFGPDPCTLVRSFVRNGNLYVDQEAYEHGLGLKDLKDFWMRIPGAGRHMIIADNSRPETIVSMADQGFKVKGCKKYSGSIEEGITFLQSFPKIIVHPRCKHLIEEFRLYRWKVEKTSEEVTRKPVDKHNHCIDALRYAYDDSINHKSRGLRISSSVAQRFARRVVA